MSKDEIIGMAAMLFVGWAIVASMTWLLGPGLGGLLAVLTVLAIFFIVEWLSE